MAAGAAAAAMKDPHQHDLLPPDTAVMFGDAQPRPARGKRLAAGMKEVPTIQASADQPVLLGDLRHSPHLLKEPVGARWCFVCGVLCVCVRF